MPGPTPPPRIGKFAGRTLEHAKPAPARSVMHKPSMRKTKSPPVTRPPPGLINR